MQEENRITENEILSKLGFVLASQYRKKIVEQLYYSPMTPKELARRTNLRLAHVSHVLSILVKEGIIKCVNPQSKKGRIYMLTETGKRIAEYVIRLK